MPSSKVGIIILSGISSAGMYLKWIVSSPYTCHEITNNLILSNIQPISVIAATRTSIGGFFLTGFQIIIHQGTIKLNKNAPINTHIYGPLTNILIVITLISDFPYQKIINAQMKK